MTKDKQPTFLAELSKTMPPKKDANFLGSKTFGGLRSIDLSRHNVAMILREMGNPAQSGQLGFSTRTLVQANLPHSNPGKDQRTWFRQNGDFSLVIQSDVNVDPKTGTEKIIGIPYGTVPRLVLFYLCSEAIRTKSRQIGLGDSLGAFLTDLGLKSTGGKKGDITRFKNQIKRLVTAKIKFQYDGDNAEAAFNASIAKKHFFFWDQNPEQPSLFESNVVLDHDFYEEIIAAPVPLHLGVVHALKSSSFALDLYTWLTYRVSRLEKPIFIKWSDLELQVGADYSDTKNFSRRARQVLGEVKTLWPHLDYDDSKRGGFMLKPCTPSVPKKNLPK